MTHFIDLSLNSYIGLPGEVRTIGWLEDGHSFQKGETSREFRKSLLCLLSYRFRDLFHLGLHWCSLCEAQGRSGPDARTSQWMIYVPALTCVYEAPSWIGHYVISHKYQPPIDFQEAVLACPRPDTLEYLDLLRRHIIFPPDFSLDISRPEPRRTLFRSQRYGRMPSNKWDPILWCSVNELELEPSTKCLLHAARISFLGELVQQTEKNLLRLPKFAESDLEQVKEALAQRCLELGAVLDFWPIPPIKSTG